MRPRGSADVLEARRRRALKLLDSGLSLTDASRRVGCSASSVLRWRDAREKLGEEAFKVRFSPGRPSKLSAGQKRRLVRTLLRGALAWGYRTELWTTTRIAEVIRRSFGVRYHRDHVGRLMHQLGWSPQKPERRARERNEKRIERWVAEQWPRVKKTPEGWAPTSLLGTKRDSS
jgi:transposase